MYTLVNPSFTIQKWGLRGSKLHWYVFVTGICYNLQAYKLGLYGPKTVWIFFAWYSSGFWTKDLDDVACSADEMEQAADGIFIFGVSYKSSPSKQTISDMTGKCDVNNTLR